MPQSQADLVERIQKFNELLDRCRRIIDDERRTKRQVSVNARHINTHLAAITKYASYRPTVDENLDYDYEDLTEKVLEKAEEYKIELSGFEQEFEEAEAAARPVPIPAQQQLSQIRFNASNIKVTIPKFKGDIQEYPKFKSILQTMMKADGKGKPEQLRVLEEHLEGRPLKLIQNLPPTDEGFDTAFEILDDKFDSAERQKQAILKSIRELPQATDELVSLKDTYNELESLLRALSVHEDVNKNDELRRRVMSKYTENIIDRVSPIGVPTLQTIRDRVKDIIRMKEDVSDVYQSYSTPITKPASISIAAMPIEPKQMKKSVTMNESKAPSTPNAPQKCGNESKPCIFCKRSNHPSEECRTCADSARRIERLPSFTCHNCFDAGHIRRNCPKLGQQCKFCEGRNHHPAICPKKFGYFKRKQDQSPETTSSQKTEEPAKSTSSQKTTVALLNQTSDCYLTARAYLRNPANGLKMNVRVFLDCGSPRTFVLNKVAKQLESTKIDTTNLAVGVFLRPEVHELQSERVKFEIIDPSGNEPHTITACTVPRITDSLGVSKVSDFRKRYPELQGLQIADETDDDEISLLLGNDYVWRFILPETKIQLADNLYVIGTAFGRMIVGTEENDDNGKTHHIKAMHVSTNIVTALWSLDTIGIQDKNYTASEEEEMALQQFNETIKYLPDERRYQVGLPFRELEPRIPTNYGLAKAVLLSLVRKYANKKHYLRTCDEIFNQQLEAGIIERAPDTDPTAEQHYLPFHFVEREGKSTPLRVVYNGSAKTQKSKLSLNEALYKGINLLNDLLGVMLRFRLHQTAVISDVEKAFHQIELIPEHRDFVRFLWVKDNENSEEIVTYRFRRIPFGVISSPFILAATMLHHLNKYNTESAERIRRDIYADNIITTFPKAQEAIDFYNGAMKIFDEAGLPLRQWQTNSAEVRNAIAPELRDTKHDDVMVLGLSWNTKKDVLAINVPEEIRKTTKVNMLTVLQFSANIYDPLGFFTPVTIRTRMFLQRLHGEKYEWETPLTAAERKDWFEIVDEMRELQNFEFQRAFTEAEEKVKSYQIHVFTDASIRAYAMVAYLRVESEDKVRTHLLIAKSRVALISTDNKLTIPRLELMSTLLGSRIIRKLTTALQIRPEPKVFQWSDSKCVLSWLRTNAALPIFVRNRVSEIKKNEMVSHRYVPSEENPADLASRGIPACDLHSPSSLWFHGPKWISTPESSWPAQSTPSDITEINVEEVLVAPVKAPEIIKPASPFEIDESKFNTYTRLIRTTGICVNFLRRFKRVRNSRIFPEKMTSVRIATVIWIRYIQRTTYEETIELLKQKKTLFLIKKFRLFLDDEGIVRAAGRLHYAPLTFSERNPILLPKPTQNKMTWLLVHHIHKENVHAGVNVTLSAVRKRYWIPAGRKQAAALLRKCGPCRREKAKPFKQPEFSVLLAFRLNDKLEPFSHIGLDVVGHFWVKKSKRWILVVTCLVIRAVALEDLENLEAETIMFALQRIQARTTKPIFYLSDNAPQFQAVKAALEKKATKDLRWKFIPAFMPWAGGVYERLMKPIKSSLYATFRDEVTVTDTQFRTIIQMIASIMNQRPISFQGEKFVGVPLTPNDFLKVNFNDISEESDIVITSSDTEVVSYLKHNLKVNIRITEQFWNTWSHSYLQFLRERAATMNFRRQTSKREVKVGDVVLLHDAVRKQRNWRMGVILQLQRSDDNSVRSAVVRIKSKKQDGEVKNITVVRPVEKLYFLELNEFEDQGNPIPAGDIANDSTSIENIIIHDD